MSVFDQLMSRNLTTPSAPRKSKKTAPKKTAPKKTAPKKTAPKKTAPKKKAPAANTPPKTANKPVKKPRKPRKPRAPKPQMTIQEKIIQCANKAPIYLPGANAPQPAYLLQPDTSKKIRRCIKSIGSRQQVFNGDRLFTRTRGGFVLKSKDPMTNQNGALIDDEWEKRGLTKTDLYKNGNTIKWIGQKKAKKTKTTSGVVKPKRSRPPVQRRARQVTRQKPAKKPSKKTVKKTKKATPAREQSVAARAIQALRDSSASASNRTVNMSNRTYRS